MSETGGLPELLIDLDGERGERTFRFPHATPDGDLVLFDPDEVQDNATFQDPHRFSDGFDIVLVNGESVDFAHHLNDGDRVSIYPVFESLDVSPLVRLRPAPLRRTKFVLDVHLGKLARWLRLLGFDTLYCNDYQDAEIVAIASRSSSNPYRAKVSVNPRLNPSR